MQRYCNHEITQGETTPLIQEIELERLKAAQEKVALLVIDDEIYLPIFERIELELAALDAQRTTVSRARAIAVRHQMAFS